MSYLLDFVRSFTGEELSVFKKMDLKGKEEEIRDVYANNALNKKFDEKALPAKYNLTQSHFDKIASILLDKVLVGIYGTDYEKMFTGILHKGLTDLMLHEIKMAERLVQTKKSPVPATDFYKAAFAAARAMFHPAYDAKLTRYYGEKYLKSLGSKKTIAHETFVAMLSLFGEILVAHRTGNEEKQGPALLAEIKRWEKKIAGTGNHPAEFYYAFALSTYCKSIGNSVEDFLAATELAYKAHKQSKGAVDEKYLGIVLAELGFGYMAADNYHKAEKYYAEALDSFRSTLGKNLYQTTNYLICLLINKKYSLAENIFFKEVTPRIQPNANRSMLFDIYVMGTLIFLHQQKMDKAFYYLNEINKYRKNEITPYGQAIMRLLQSLYFLLIGDYKTAVAVVNKNLKFLRKPENSATTYHYHFQFIDTVGKIAKYRLGSLKSSAKLKQQILSLPRGIYAVNNVLLQPYLNELP